jgi:hypothetical protein
MDESEGVVWGDMVSYMGFSRRQEPGPEGVIQFDKQIRQQHVCLRLGREDGKNVGREYANFHISDSQQMVLLLGANFQKPCKFNLS